MMLPAYFVTGYVAGCAATAAFVYVRNVVKSRRRRRDFLAAMQEVEPVVREVREKLRALKEDAGVFFVEGGPSEWQGPYLVTLPFTEVDHGSDAREGNGNGHAPAHLHGGHE